MKKSLLLSVALCAAALPVVAQKTFQTKGSGVMQTNDIYNVTVGPGTVETRTVLHFSTSASDNVEDINAQATVNILKVDLNNEYVTPKVAFADKHAIQDVAKTIPQMMAENTSYQNHYFAGVNGDFFGYITCGVTVADGMYVYAGNFLGEEDNAFEGNHLVIDKDGLPYIADHVEFGCGLGIRNGYPGDRTVLGKVEFPDGTTNDQLRYNEATRYADYMVLYSPYINRMSTGTNQWGTEASLTPVGSTMFGAESEFEVGEVTKSGTGGNMAIPEGGYVLSGVTSSNFNDKVVTGDKVKLTIPFKADGVDNTCRETVGGWPRLVTDGTPLAAVPTQTPSDLAGSSRRARTAVGFSEDRKTMYIVVVEEGSTKNQGLTFMALGSFMEAIGCYNAMNLDGGGSSVMHVENLGQRTVVQGLTSTYNRPVMNGLFLATNAPEDRKITSIEFVDKSLDIKPGRGYVPTIYGYNKYGVLICTNVTEYTLSAPDGTATFTSGDRKMIAPESGEFKLTATYGNATFEIPVKVTENGIEGVDPTTEAAFDKQETTPIPGESNGEKVMAELTDITPAGYDWSQYEVGTEFKFADLPETFGAAWTAPSGIYNQENFDRDGHVTAVHLRGMTSDGQDAEMLDNVKKAFTIQDLGGNIGKCLVFNQQWSPGHSEKGWPFTTLAGKATTFPNGIQLSFYPDATLINKGDITKPIRVRLVMQLLYRGRHDQSKPAPIPSIYTSAYNATTNWAVSHNGVADNETGNLFPIKGSDFYRWVDEGTSIATMPEKHVNANMLGTVEPWDASNANNAANPYLINSDRFMVYEYDLYTEHIGGIALHVNIDSNAPWVSYVFREVRFFNVENGEELVPGGRSLTSNTTGGSLAGTRSITYRYYTDDGMSEIDTLGDRFSSVDNIVADNDDNAPIEYYNLQGLRVDNPTGGLYIKRQGNRVTKVIVR